MGCTVKSQFIVDTSNSTKEPTSYTLSGEFPLFQELNLQNHTNNNLHSQSNVLSTKNQKLFQKSCANPTVTLHEIESNGEINQIALSSTQVTGSGQFQFTLPKSSVNLNASSTEKAMVLQITGCQNEVYLRPVTGLTQQKVSAASTVISYLFNSSLKSDMKSMLESSPEQITALISSIETAADFGEAQQLLTTSTTAQTKFNQLFSTTANVLNDVSPMITANVIPNTASESVAVELSITTKHFSSNYQPVYLWKLNNQVIGNQANFQWTPTANMQGSHTLSVFVGIDDGQGLIDQTKPFKQVTQTIEIDNHVLPTAPTFSVITPTIVNNLPISQRSITLGITTGTMLSECQSFSRLAITENTTNQPSVNDFTIECTDANTQNLNYQLSTSSDGLKTLRLWAKDASGVISESATQISLSLDTGAPSAVISTTPLAMSKLNTQSFAFNATDDGGVVSHFQCQLDNAGWENCTSPKIYQSLTEGSHTFQLKAIDTAGNESTVVEKSWFIDLTNPSIQLTHQPALITNSLSATFQFLGSDAGGSGVSSYECQINNGNYVACVSPLIEVVTAGQKSIKVRSIDQAGNKSDAVEYLWTIDTTMPTVSITQQPASLTNAATASLSFLGTDTGGASISGYQCSLNGSAFTSCSSPKSYNSLSAGVQEFSVKAIDTAGNIGAATSYQWTVDLTTPMASISLSPNSLTNLTTAQFEFSATPPAGGSITGYECSLNSGAWESCTSPKSISGLTAGLQTFQLRSIDNNNNRSQVTSYQWTIDTTLPVLSLQSSPASLNNLTSAALTFAATDANSISGYQCQINGGQYSSCSSPLNLSDLTTGVQNVNIQAMDMAGNLSQTLNITWTTDLLSPTTVIQTSPQSVNNSTTASLTFTGSDFGGGSIDHFECSTDQNNYSLCTSPFQLNNLNVGVQQIYVRAIDTAANVGTAVSATWIVDQTNPTVSIQTTIASVINSSSQSISFNGSDTGGGAIDRYECAMDAEAFSNCTSPKNYTGLTEGNRQFKVKAIDTAGNTSDVQTISWTIDLTAPSLSITTPSTNGNVVQTSGLNNFAIGGACSENGRSVVLGGSVSGTATCSSSVWSTSVDLSGLSDGTISVTATQSDVAGNSTTTSARTVIKDTVVPVISVTTPTALKGNSATGSVSWTLTESNVASSSNFNVEIFNGSVWSSVGTKAATAGLNSSVGYTHTSFNVPNVDVATARLRVTLVDAAGNSTTSTTNDFIIDSTVPQLTSFTINDGNQVTLSSTLLLKINTTDSLSGVSHVRFAEASGVNCQSSYTDNQWQTFTNNGGVQSYSYISSFTNGTKKVCAWAKDLVGNVTAISENNGEGQSTVNMATISLDQGSAPVFTSLTVKNGNSSSAYFNTSTFNVGDQLSIQFTVTDDAGLANKPVSIYSTTDNTNYTLIASEDSVGTAGSGSLTWTTTVTNLSATTASYFRLRFVGKDLNGNTVQVMSEPLNTGKWSLFAGNIDTGDGASAIAARIKMNTSDAVKNSVAVNSKNEIFISTLTGIRKVDPLTGNVAMYLQDGNGTQAGIPGNVTTSTRSITSNGASNIVMDGNDLYITTTDRIYLVDTALNTIKVFAGGGTLVSTTNPNELFVWKHGAIEIDPATKDLYLVNICNYAERNSSNMSNSSYFIQKISQNTSTKTAQTVSHYAGNCVKGSVTNGAVATETPLENSIYAMAHGSLVYVPNLQTLYFSPYGGKILKFKESRVYFNSSFNSTRGAVYVAQQNRIYFANGPVVYYVPTATAGFDETQVTYLNAESTCVSLNCRDDNIAISQAVTNTTSVFNIGGKLGIVEGQSNVASLPVRIRVVDEVTNKIQTIIGTDRSSGNGQDKSLTRFGSISSLLYKDVNSGGVDAGLYVADEAAYRVMYYANGANTTMFKYGSGIGLYPLANTDIGVNHLGLRSLFFMAVNPIGGLTFSGQTMWTMDADQKLQSIFAGTSATNAISITNGTISGTTGITFGEHYSGLVYDHLGNIYFGGYHATAYNISRLRVRKTDGSIHTVIGNSTNVSSADCTTAGCASSLSIRGVSASYGTTETRMGPFDSRFNSGEGRLLFTDLTKIRFINKPYDATQSKLSTLTDQAGNVIDFGRNVGAFKYTYVDGSSEQIDKIYYMSPSDGKLYCYKVSTGSDANCNNTSLGPSTTITSGSLRTSILEMDSAGNLYVVRSSGDAIYKYSP